MTVRPLVAGLIGAMVGAAAAAQSEPAAPPDSGTPVRFEFAPGGGLLCTLATFHIVAGAGRHCFAGQDAPFQSALAESVARLEAHAQANSATTRADLDAFARAMAGEERAGGESCDGEAAGLYRAVRDSGLEALRTEVERQLALPGPAQWGECR
jgi:hypothetical protein